VSRDSHWGILFVIASRLSAAFVVAIGCVVLTPIRAHAQWWRIAPADFEACADAAEKAKTKEDKTSALAECNAKFAGRRKPGGGYTYYDFMQDRTFDIAGPNPTPEEQKKIDEQYTAYLEKQRRNSIAAALMAKQQEQQQGARGKPGQAGRTHPGHPLRQEFILLRLAAALAEYRGPEEAVRLVAGQSEA